MSKKNLKPVTLNDLKKYLENSSNKFFEPGKACFCPLSKYYKDTYNYGIGGIYTYLDSTWFDDGSFTGITIEHTESISNFIYEFDSTFYDYSRVKGATILKELGHLFKDI